MELPASGVPDLMAALQAEAAGGATVVLPDDAARLSSLLWQRELRRRELELTQPETELIAAMPAAAGLLASDGRVRASNAALDGLAPGGRAVGRTVPELTRQEELAGAAQRAMKGATVRLEVQFARRIWKANAVPLLRGEVLLLLRDVTDARQAQAVQRDFVANASHELRTPVSAIAGAAETLLSGAIHDPTQARSFAEMIARNAERLGRLASDLLDLSLIESRRWPVRLGPVPVVATARRVLELCSEPARRKAIELRVGVPEGTTVHADPGALEQVLVNLLDNAVKYTPGGGSATISASALEGDRVEIAVTDTGPGIERHHLPRLFERFYRVDPGRSRDVGGTGLGLAIVKHLVQIQGGEVGVDTGSGGTSFRVRLPRSGADKSSPSA